MASSKHFLVQKYSLAPNLSGANVPCTKMLLGCTDSPLDIEPPVSTTTSQQQMLDPYAPVTSFKYYDCSELSASNEGHKVVSNEMNPDSHCQYLDDTIVSAYERGKPSLPVKPTVARPSNLQGAVQQKDKQSMRDFNPEGINMQKGYKEKTDMKHEYSQSDPLGTHTFNKVNLPAKLKPGSVLNINDNCCKDTYKESSEDSDSLSSVFFDAKKIGDNSRPSSAGRRKLPIAPQSRFNNSLSRQGCYVSDQNVLCAKEVSDLTSVSLDFDKDVATKLSEIIKDVKKNKDRNDSGDINSEIGIKHSDLYVNYLSNSCDRAGDNHCFKTELLEGNENDSDVQLRKCIDSRENIRESKLECVNENIYDSKVNSVKDNDELIASAQTNNSPKVGDLNRSDSGNIKKEIMVSDPSQQLVKEMARRVKSKLATKLALAEKVESLGPGPAFCHNSSHRKNIDSANEMASCKAETATTDKFFNFDADVIQELTDSVMTKTSKVKEDGSRNFKTSKKMMEHFKELPKSRVNEELVYYDSMFKESFEGKSVFEKLVKETKDYKKEINEKNSLLSGDKQYVPNKPKVERTPSYKNKVIARAKNKYQKKSSMHKECSCQKDENGARLLCEFCVLYEHKRRSKSSLGNMSINKIGEQDESENGVIKSPRRAVTPGGMSVMSSGKSPRPVKKVHVSSRVDVLMSTDLFRKHLQKHEDLLTQHTKLQRAGMRKSISNLDLTKSVSNLDLTTGLEGDSDSNSVLSFVNVDIDDVHVQGTKDANINVDNLSAEKVESKSVSAVEGVRNQTGKKKSASRTLPKTVGKSCLSSSCMNNNTVSSKYAIPTLDEFKKSKTRPALHRGWDNTNQLNSFNEIIMQKQSDFSDNVDECDNFKKTDSECANNGTIQAEKNLILHSLRAVDDIKVSNTAHISEDFEHDTINIVEQIPEVIEVQKESTTAYLETDCQGVELQQIQNSKTSHGESRSVQTAPSMRLKQRMRPKLKSRTLSRLELENEESQILSDTSEPSGASARERRKPGSKRPRSLISKKSSLIKLLQEQENAANGSEVLDSSDCKSIQDRPKLKVMHSVGRSKSDTHFETDRSKLSVKSAFRSGSSSSENNSFVNSKGKNSVCFDLEDESRCSPFDIGESETSTSVAGSLSDSIRSELVTDEPGELLVDTDHGTKHLNHSYQDGGDPTSYLMGMEHMAPVGRSTSDACKITLEAARKRRERKERPYKSDPFSGTEIIPAAKRCALREERERLGRHHASLTEAPSDEIFSFLGDLGPGESYPSLEELQEGAEQFSPLSTSISQDADQLIKVRKNPSNVSSLSTDSGVIGQDGSHDSQQSSPTNTLSHSMSERHRSAWQHHPLPGRSLSVSCGDLSSDVASECPECNSADQVTTEMRCPSYQLCTRCCQRRLERKKTIQEVMETEVNYGRDLSLLKEEFYQPMLKAGLLTQDQLDTVFLNLDELIHVNRHFISKLRSAIHSANANNDNDLQEVMIGNLFLESSTMFLTFENYCVNQSQAPVLLEQYEREKELVRIFLQALQNDNQQLRRMHLKSFLMVPVQRIMKYPLLLDRLYRNTSGCHGDKLCLREAKNKIEDILTHINARSQITIISRQRKTSSVRKTSCSVSVKMEVSRVALETLKWKRKEVCDIISGQLLVTQPLDHLWASKRCKNYKFTMVYGVLMTSLETISDPQLNDSNVINDNNNGQVKSAAVVLIREKGGRFQVFREPFMLDKCIVSQDKDFLEVFEILEWNKDAFIVKAETIHETKLWLQHLRQQMNRLGNWRKRRNAMPNILLNHNH